MKSISLKYFLRNQLESPCPKFNEVRYISPSELKEFIYNDEEFDEMDKIKLSTDSITKEEFFEKLGIKYKLCWNTTEFIFLI